MQGGGLYSDATFSVTITASLNREMFSSSVDAGFILVPPFHHGDLEPDCVEIRRKGWGGGEFRLKGYDIKIPLQDFALKLQGGAYA